jgi:hypothetical protein
LCAGCTAHDSARGTVSEKLDRKDMKSMKDMKKGNCNDN